MASSLKSTTKESLSETSENVMYCLQAASKYGLEVEVIATAMVYIKENPDKSIEDALNVGLSDWDI